MDQTITGNTPLAAQYGAWGVAGKRTDVDPSKIFGWIVGESNVGKTSLLASHPGALVLNFDVSSVPVPAKKATAPPGQFWPALSSDGRPTDADGNFITFDWEACKTMKQRLVDAARDNRPRPVFIVCDSIAAMIPMVITHVLKQLGKAMHEADGRMVWGRVSDEIVQFTSELKQAGYGVWWVVHITKKKLPVGDNAFVEDVRVSVQDSIYRRAYPLAEAVIAISKRLATETIKTDKTVTLSNGRTVVNPVETTVQKVVYELAIDSPALFNLVKTRSPMPRTVLPPENGWAVFEKAFRDAVSASA